MKSLHSKHIWHAKKSHWRILVPIENEAYKYQLAVSPYVHFIVSVWKGPQLTIMKNTCILCRLRTNPVPCHVVTVPWMPTCSLIRIARICLIQQNETAATDGESGRDNIWCNAWEQIHIKLRLKSGALNLVPICPVHQPGYWSSKGVEFILSFLFFAHFFVWF